jgi:serine/threonine-protein kinase
MRLGSQLRLFRALGSGGMGSIWLAEHLGLHMPVAVKFLREQLLACEGAVARMRREAAAAARIRSPHVVQIFDLQVTSEGIPYIVMELLEGESLEDHLAWRGHLTLDETAAIVRQVGAALTKAHDLGIVHRDIKPENVFLLDGEREIFVKVLDFGVALDLSDRSGARLTIDGALVGTPSFMSPEQMIGCEVVGPAADVWALGVVAYRCLTQTLPYSGDSVAAIAIAVDRGPPEPASKYVPDLPPSVDEWLLRMLEPRPERRFRDARAMLEAFEEAYAIAKGDRSRLPTVRDQEVTVRIVRSSRLDVSTEATTLRVGRPRPWRQARRFAAASLILVALVVSVWFGASSSREASAVEGLRPLRREAQPAEPKRAVEVAPAENR